MLWRQTGRELNLSCLAGRLPGTRCSPLASPGALRPSGFRGPPRPARYRAPLGRGGQSAAHSRARRADYLPRSPAPRGEVHASRRRAAPLGEGAGWPGRKGEDRRQPSARQGAATNPVLPVPSWGAREWGPAGSARHSPPLPSSCRKGPPDPLGAERSAERPARPPRPTPLPAAEGAGPRR